MEPKTLAQILLRVLAVYLMAKGILYLPELATVASATKSFSGAFPNIGILSLVVIAPLVFGLGLWAASPKIAGLMVAQSNSGETNSPATLPQIQSAILATVGLLLVFLTLPSIVTIAFQILEESEHSVVIPTAVLASHIARLVLGILLIVGAGALVRLVNKAREFGLEEKASNK